MTDFLLIMRVLFENTINFLVSIKVPGVGITFMQLFIGVFAFGMFISAFHTMFDFSQSLAKSEITKTIKNHTKQSSITKKR